VAITSEVKGRAVSKERLAGRVSQIREAMRQRELGALVIYASPQTMGYLSFTSGNVRYLTDWRGHTPAVLLLPLEGEPILFTTLTIRTAADQDGEDPSTGHDIRPLTGHWPPSPKSAIREGLEDRGVTSGRVGVVGVAEMSPALYQTMTAAPSPWDFTGADDVMASVRMIKDPGEIEAHRAAAKVSEAMLFAIMHAARSDSRRASDLMVEAEHIARSLGADWAGILLATGQTPDYLGMSLFEVPEPIQSGDRVQAVTLVQKDGYWGHELRIGVKGKPSAELKRYSDGIKDAQQAGLDELRPGNKLVNVYKAMMQRRQEHSPDAADTGIRQGHGLGLQYTEPVISEAFLPLNRVERESEIVVQPGMVLELHPNYAPPGLGHVFLGDVVLVTESGPEFLTRFPRELYDI
jgi:Xaa-Pro dipeptidase